MRRVRRRRPRRHLLRRRRAGPGRRRGPIDGGRSRGNPYTPANVLATLYRHLGIDPATTIPDHNQRPMHVLDDREIVRELV